MANTHPPDTRQKYHFNLQFPKELRPRTSTMYYTAITKQDGDWWLGWIEEVPGVNCQERTSEELLRSLKTALAEALTLTAPSARSERP